MKHTYEAMTSVISEGKKEMAKEILKVKNVSRGFDKDQGELLVLDHVNFDLKEGEIVGLLGRSGSGKSTLLRIISGLIQPSSGEVLQEGQLLNGPAQGTSMVFQTFALFPWMTVLENVELGLEALGINQKERRDRALAAIDLIGLDGFENAYPRELSGGMRQRVGFARALVVDPKILLMDEPFSALDVLTAETLRADFMGLWTKGQTPIKSTMIVTHNIEEAVFMCDRILVLSSNPGKITAEIKINFPHPRNRLDPAFRELVDDIYAKMTGAQAVADSKLLSISSLLQPVSTNLISGLIETLASGQYQGHAGMQTLSRALLLEADDLFPIVELLSYLDFAKVQNNEVVLTKNGETFAGLDIQNRKILFGQQLLRHIPLASRIKRVLGERRGHRAPRDRFLHELEDVMSEHSAKNTLDAVIDWARYGEVFYYDAQNGVLSLQDTV